ncbi:MAG: glutamate racemase, partial [Patescibacteria group bacterium]|nr:glutamate racemase [Patescibacteria group bacterium]
IGIFDSGIGGLGIFQAVKNILPRENIIYFADSAHFPYGEKTYSDLQKLAEKIVDFLIKHECKLIVVACNTASVSSLDYLRTKFNLPIIGVVPVVKSLARATITQNVAILATKLTIKSKYLRALIEEFCPEEKGFKVFLEDAQDIVNAVEQGNLNMAKKSLPKIVRIVKKNKIDAIALGSTHLAFFKEKIQEAVGLDVSVLDSNLAVAKQALRVLSLNKQPENNNRAEYKFYTTGNEIDFYNKIETLIKIKYPKVEKVSLG